MAESKRTNSWESEDRSDSFNPTVAEGDIDEDTVAKKETNQDPAASQQADGPVGQFESLQSNNERALRNTRVSGRSEYFIRQFGGASVAISAETANDRTSNVGIVILPSVSVSGGGSRHADDIHHSRRTHGGRTGGQSAMSPTTTQTQTSAQGCEFVIVGGGGGTPSSPSSSSPIDGRRRTFETAAATNNNITGSASLNAIGTTNEPKLSSSSTTSADGGANPKSGPLDATVGIPVDSPTSVDVPSTSTQSATGRNVGATGIGSAVMGYRSSGRALAVATASPPLHQQRSASANNRRMRNSPFCPCFSPTDSDDEENTADAQSSTTVAVSGVRPSVPVTAAGASGGACQQILNLAREIRSRFVVVADASAQQQGPMPLRRRLQQNAGILMAEQPYPVHTNVGYTHCLVPDLLPITNAPYYWGVMDRFEAERLLDGKPEGTFLLRDSAQNEYLFSVSFRRYQRTLHARIEQLSHRFSFDSYDPGVFSATSVTALIDNYKDPARCLFFEPQLTHPLHRNFVFPLSHLARSAVCQNIAYSDISTLPVPRQFKEYLREYHYKHPVRVTSVDSQQ